MSYDTPLNPQAPKQKENELDKKMERMEAWTAVSLYVVATGFNCLLYSPLLSSLKYPYTLKSKSTYHCIWMWSCLVNCLRSLLFKPFRCGKLLFFLIIGFCLLQNLKDHFLLYFSNTLMFNGKATCQHAFLEYIT